MKLEPIFDRIILKRIKETETKTKSGLFIPTSIKESPYQGEIVAITDKEMSSCSLKKGDFVLYPNYNAVEFIFENETYDVIKSCDILCKINKGENEYVKK